MNAGSATWIPNGSGVRLPVEALRSKISTLSAPWHATATYLSEGLKAKWSGAAPVGVNPMRDNLPEDLSTLKTERPVFAPL